MFGHFFQRAARGNVRWALLTTGVAVSVAACSGAPARPVAAVVKQTPVTQTATPQPKLATATGASCAAPALIAHRGEGGQNAENPENTSAAELEAARHGATVLDVDVRWTLDDVPVAIHDATLDRTTNGDGPVLSVTAAEFAKLLLKDNDGSRRRDAMHPQTLARLLAAVKVTGLPIILQMEADPFAQGDGYTSMDELADVISASGYVSNIIVGGWTARDVRAFGSVDPGVRTAFIQEEPSDPSPQDVKAADTNTLYIDYRLVTAARVAAWHASGIAVWVWTPPFQAQWVSLKKAGVDAIATNWVPTFVNWSRPCKLDQPS